MNIKRLSEKYLMLSACLSSQNIERFLFDSISKYYYVYMASKKNLYEWLRNINEYNINNIDEYEDLLTSYNDMFLNYPAHYIKEFISFCSSDLIKKIVKLSYFASGIGRKSVPLNNANVIRRNLIFTFDSKVFSEYITKEIEIPFYANAFWHYIMLILLTEYVNRFSNTPIPLDMGIAKKYLCLCILTGEKLSAEFETDVLYPEIFEEISQIVPSNKHNMLKTVNEEKQTVMFRIKNPFMFVNAFEKEGYKKVKRIFEPPLDRKSECELRIKQGSRPNSIEIVLYITGMRTISRILSLNANPLNKVYLHNFWEKGGYFVSLILSFCFRTIFQNCSHNIEKSHYSLYNQFIGNFKGKRNIALKSAVTILLSELSANKRKRLIDKYFQKNDYAVKKDINKKLKQLDAQLLNDKKKYSLGFEKILRRYYGW